ncbi:TM2 domain-containing protein [Clostridium sp. AL.422]|uniref:TM2 domain-containing protein n=1 Tax=Clostridium TaxID=1485 RepID=UPI00293DB407|nr:MULTISPECIES: TM2 domain-containing protein [unclassified Clostridium]MDV4150359.1 TM2 domain-containing protein [Clostridium sp. AL.422]
MRYTTITSDKSKKKALIICAIGGIWGIHDFYLGKIGSGIVKFFTCNYFSIGWIVDLIKISTGGYKDNVGAPLRK